MLYFLLLNQNEPAVHTEPAVHHTAPGPAASSLNPAPVAPAAVTAPRDTLEYRTALELELWKEEQEELFGDQVEDS